MARSDNREYRCLGGTSASWIASVVSIFEEKAATVITEHFVHSANKSF